MEGKWEIPIKKPLVFLDDVVPFKTIFNKICGGSQFILP